MIIVEMSYQEFLSYDTKNSLNNSLSLKSKEKPSELEKVILVKVAETSTGVGTYLVKWP